jgi:hypothetical protein
MGIRMKVIPEIKTAFPGTPGKEHQSAKRRAEFALFDPSDRLVRKEVRKATVPLPHVEPGVGMTGVPVKLQRSTQCPQASQGSSNKSLFRRKNHEYKD